MVGQAPPWLHLGTVASAGCRLGRLRRGCTWARSPVPVVAWAGSAVVAPGHGRQCRLSPGQAPPWCRAYAKGGETEKVYGNDRHGLTQAELCHCILITVLSMLYRRLKIFFLFLCFSLDNIM